MHQAADFARFYFWVTGFALAAGAAVAGHRGAPAAIVAMLAGHALLQWVAAFGWKRNTGWARVLVPVASLIALWRFPLGTIVGCVGLVWSFSAKARLRAATPAADAKERGGAPERYESKAGDGTAPWIQAVFPLLWLVTLIGSLMLATKWGHSLGLPKEAAVNGVAAIATGWFVSVFLHELGHAVAAELGAMKVRLFQVGPLRLEKTGGNWKLIFSWEGLIGMGGGVASVPSHTRNLRGRMLAEVAAGPAASLVAGLAAAYLVLAIPGSGWEAWWKLPAAVAAVSLHAGLLNLVPLGSAEAFSDGAGLLQLIRGGPFADYRAAMKLVGSTTVSGTRPRDIEPEYLAKALEAGDHMNIAGTLQMIQLICALDRGDQPQARVLLDRGMERMPTPDRAPDAECAVEIGLYLAYLDGHAGRAAEWLQASEALAERRGERLEDSFDYWFSLAAVRKAEGRDEEAEAAFERAGGLLAKKPNAGLYNYERDLFERVRAGAWVAEPPGAAPTGLCA